MKFSIDSSILSKISLDYAVAFIVVTGLDLKKDAAELILQDLVKVEDLVKNRYNDSKKIQENFTVNNFTKVISLMGIDAKVSLENMFNLIGIKHKSLVMNDSFINFYNAFVLQNELPAGAYDLDRIVGDVQIRNSYKTDKFKQLNKSDYLNLESETVVLADENEVLCTDWVSKQSDTQKIRPTTKNVMIRLEGLAYNSADLKDKVKLLKQNLKKYYKFDDFDFVILDSKNPVDEITLNKKIEQRRLRYVDSLELLSRGVSNVVVYEDVLSALIDGKTLRIKHGVDPTTKDLHLGYAVNYLKLKQFQDRGHKIIFLIGSFTARFGDPTDKGETRTMKEKKMVLDMAKNYIKQVGRILDVKKMEIRYNGDWFDKMSAEDLLRLMSEFTVARMLERDMFAKRMKEGKEIGLHEIIYPMLQGYDSVELKSDLTVIGTDQTFNELQARSLQTRRGQNPQNIIAMDLLVGTDGKMKMSQSLGNYIGFDDEPNEKFGKIMSIPDNLIYTYFTSCTTISAQELENIRLKLNSDEVNPRDLKIQLANTIVTMFDGETAALKAEEHFKTVFQNKEIPDEMQTYTLLPDKYLIIDVLVDSGVCKTNSEARRLITQGGLKIDSEKITDINFEFNPRKETIVQAGKRKFLRVI